MEKTIPDGATAKTTWLAIQDEYEGDAPLYFPLSEPQRIADYLVRNAELGQEYRFKVEELTPDQVGALSTD